MSAERQPGWKVLAWLLAAVGYGQTRPLPPTPVAPVGPPAALGRRWLVVSPHLDDAVLSLGASIAAHVRGGGTVTVLTVIAGDPAGPGPVGPWDASCGFASEAEATAARRVEDRAAFALLGGTVVHVDGADAQYGRDRPDPPASVVELATDHDEVFVPGHPLAHDDHRWVSDVVGRMLVDAGVPFRLYVEEPYANRAPEAAPAEWAARVPCSWSRPIVVSSRDRLDKVRATARYTSQLASLVGQTGPSPGPRTAARALGEVWASARRGEWVSQPIVSAGPPGG